MVKNGQGAGRCSTGRRKKQGSCFTDEELGRAARDMQLPALMDRAGLYESVLKRASCDGDRCLANSGHMSSEVRESLSGALRPVAPHSWMQKDTTWLTNEDIEKKARCLVGRLKSHKFIGVFPMNAHHAANGGRCVSRDVCEFDFAKAGKRYRHVSMVFNTDYAGMPGSHWVAMVVFLRPSDKRYGIYYYDSLGKTPSDDTDQLVTMIADRMGHPTRPPYVHNDTKNQFRDSECGMFSLRFIDLMINKRCTIHDVAKRMGGDEDMVALRKTYFDNPGWGSGIGTASLVHGTLVAE